MIVTSLLFLGSKALAKPSSSTFEGRPKPAANDPLRSAFLSPPNRARPWVYWYFMDGNITKEGLRADLEAWKKAGIGGGIYLEVDNGIPRGPVEFMSPEWQGNFKYAVSESQRLGLQIGLGTGPGWAGDGGPWVTPDLSMQHMVASETPVTGPAELDVLLARPKARVPFFGMDSLSAESLRDWTNYYQDEAVLAFPTPAPGARISDSDAKAIYYRAPYSSARNVPPRIPAPSIFPTVLSRQTVSTERIVDLTDRLGADGRLKWKVPAGNWTIMRFGRTTTGASTRPAPIPGLGLESDKFSREAVLTHLDHYIGTLLKTLGPHYRQGDTGLTFLHFDSWEMGSQNWTQTFKSEFLRRRGYDPTPFLPTLTGIVVDTLERSERFLWDLRQTANELIRENHIEVLKAYAHRRGLKLSLEPYDMSPASDLDLGGAGDLPMGEFWSRKVGFDTDFSLFEAVSAGHTNGLSVIGAESFTALGEEAWKQHPGSMKNQLDWALCTGINKIAFHRYQHQPKPGELPGMTMGPFGVHWEATQTWWDMVPAFHRYIARASEMLRQGSPVADILYLTPEGAPQVFTPPPSALTPIPPGQGHYSYFYVNPDGSGGITGPAPSDAPVAFRDRKGYTFDGCSPKTLMSKAKVVDGNLVFPGGAAYRILVLPEWDTMTPELLRKITELVKAGAMIMGPPPVKSPSLSGYPKSDAEVVSLASRLWGTSPNGVRKVGRGRVYYARMDIRPRLETAKWIWAAGGDPAVAAAPETLFFTKTIEIDTKRMPTSAMARLMGDNHYELVINGKSIGTGKDFHEVAEFDIRSTLKPGRNEVRVSVTNTGPDANPAGLVGEVLLGFADGRSQVVGTGADWGVARTANGPKGMAAELGDYGMKPWGRALGIEPIYVPYEATATVLNEMGVQPDFTSDRPMRFIHRRVQGGDLYFVGNTAAQSITTKATFRVAGKQPEWWNPVTGETRPLERFTVEKGRTTIPLQLAGYESGFVVFRSSLAKKPSTSRAASNFPVYATIQTLGNSWDVAFDEKWGAPAHVVFPRLTDWSQSDHPGIRYYSGKATYRTTFDGPLRDEGGKFAIGLGRVENIASVRLNGRDLGVVWCAPWQADIPAGILKEKGNRLEITVANLWSNRLIGDARLPEAERKTKTTFRPYGPNSPLLPSGLLGPVTVKRVKSSAH